MEAHDRLKAARIDAGFKDAKAAAERFGWNVVTYRSHENGTRGLTVKNVPPYARAFKVTASWLLTGEGGGEEIELPYLDVPLVSWISAGNLKNVDGVREADIERYVPVAGLPKGDWVALQVSGDSMNRIAPEDSVIVVNRADDTLVDGKFYVFALEDGSATFKRYRRTPEPMLQPYSNNMDHLPLGAADRELYVFGRVRRVITDL